MGATVDFYRKPRFEAEKIEHVSAEWHLPFDLPTVDLTIAELAPHDFFGVCFCPTQ
jgi:hypothetical protein